MKEPNFSKMINKAVSFYYNGPFNILHWMHIF